MHDSCTEHMTYVFSMRSQNVMIQASDSIWYEHTGCVEKEEEEEEKKPQQQRKTMNTIIINQYLENVHIAFCFEHHWWLAIVTRNTIWRTAASVSFYFPLYFSKGEMLSISTVFLWIYMQYILILSLLQLTLLWYWHDIQVWNVRQYCE